MHSATQIHAHARFAAAVTLALIVAACSGDSQDAGNEVGGQGGEAATGGSNGNGASGHSSGGKAGAGAAGMSGAAGEPANNGGNAGTPNSAGAGGSVGNPGGAAGTGGSSGAAGAAGAAGAGGAGASGAGAGGELGTSGAAAAGAAGQAGGGGEGGEGTSVPGLTGTGDDGALSVDAAVNLSTDNSGTRVCADGGDAVSYAVTALDSTTATLASAPGAGCLAVGDEVLLINLQGTETSSENVGNYETLRVSAVTEAGVSFTTAKTHFYGDAADGDTNIGADRANQRVMLQRVPNYQSVSVGAAGALTASGWDGVKGGVLYFRAAGLVSVAGTLSMSGKGYDGGPHTTVVNTTGLQGESFAGLGARLATANQGGGGGGLGDAKGCRSYGTSGSGAGYGTPGGASLTTCSAAGGLEYGASSLLTKLMLGSGGGAGGTDNVLSDNPPGGLGGRGGGIVVIAATNIEVSGTVMAAGLDGEGDLIGQGCNGGSVVNCWDYSGPGGAGSGGSILFDAIDAALGADLVQASGGFGGYGAPAGEGGDGGDGRIAVYALTSLTGTTLPLATVND